MLSHRAGGLGSVLALLLLTVVCAGEVVVEGVGADQAKFETRAPLGTPICGVTLCNTNASTESTCVVTEPKDLSCGANDFSQDQLCECRFELKTNLEILAPIRCGVDLFPPYSVAQCENLLLCTIVFDLSSGLDKSITLRQNGTIVAPGVEIIAAGISFINTTSINTTGLGYPPVKDYGGACEPSGQPTTATYAGYGASHGGTGGLGGANLNIGCSTFSSYLDQPQTKNNIIGNVTFPDEKGKNWDTSFGASGGCSGGLCGGRGGGRIKIDVLSINLGTSGNILANGEAAPTEQPTKECCGGGAGGTISLSAAKFSGSGSITANGGRAALINTTNIRGAGGGGRVALRIGDSSFGGTITTYGGSTDGSSWNGPTPAPNPDCFAGGHGTIFNIAYKITLRANTSVVQISGPVNTKIQPQSVTPLVIQSIEKVFSLYVESNAVVQAGSLELTLLNDDTPTSGIFINTGGLALMNFGNFSGSVTMIRADRINVGIYGVIDATGRGTGTGTLQMEFGVGGLVVLGSMAFEGNVFIKSTGIVSISGCLGTQCSNLGRTMARSDEISSNYTLVPEEDSDMSIFGGAYASRKNWQWLKGVSAGSSGNIFVNSSASIIVRPTGILYADSYILVTQNNDIEFLSTGVSAGGTQRGPCLQEVTTRTQCSDIAKTVWDKGKWPQTNFTAVALSRNGNIKISGFLGGDRLLFCTLGKRSSVAVGDAGTVSSKGNGCGGAYPVGQTPFPKGGGVCNESTTSGGGGGHGGNGGSSQDRQPGGKMYPPSKHGYSEESFIPTLDGGSDLPFFSVQMKSEPLLAGAGGGCSGGGAGGGVIVVDTAIFDLRGKIIADGLPGTMSTGVNEGAYGGGGAGGSVAVAAEVFTASSHGLITVNGGTGVPSSSSTPKPHQGGGGAGGRLFIRWKSQAWSSIHGQSWTQNFSGNLSIVGGLPNGNPGRMTTPICPRGSKLNLLETESGIPRCMVCPEGHFSNDATIDISGVRQCKACGPGTYANGTGNTECVVCAAGYICKEIACGYCSPCSIGSFSASNTTCVPCTNAPANSHYSRSGQSVAGCAYTCSAGYVGASCITPLDRLIQALGGAFTALCILGGALLFVVVVSYLMCIYIPGCPGHFKERFDIKQFRGLRRLPTYSVGSDNDSLGGSGYHTPSIMSPMLKPSTAAFDSPMLRAAGLERGNYERNYNVRGMSTEQQHEISLTLMERDLCYHVYRMYAKGNNTPGNAWEFPLKLPLDLHAIIDSNRFSHFVRGLNASLLWKETWCQEIARNIGNVLFYPFSRKLFFTRRKETVLKARRFVFEYDHAMMRGHKAKALMNCIKIGVDEGHTNCFMDLLYVEVAPIPPPLRLGKPELPLALVFSGDGSWDSPFRLDPNCVLIASVPSLPMLSHFIDANWVSFLSDLNTALRTILPDDIDGTVFNTLGVLDRLGEEDLGGLRVRLAKFFPSSVMRLGVIVDMHPQRITAAPSTEIDMALTPKRKLVASTRQMVMQTTNGKPPLPAAQPSTGQKRRLSIREQMLSEITEDEVFNVNCETSETSEANLEVSSTELPITPARGLGYTTGLLDDSDVAEGIDVKHEGESWIYDGVLYIPTRPSRCRCQCLMLNFWRTMPMRTEQGQDWCRFGLILLLLADTIATAFLLLNFWCIQVSPTSAPDNGCSRLGILSFVLLYPLANIISPLLGLTATVFSLPRWARRFAEWNSLSVLNAATGIGVYYYYMNELDVTSFYGTFLLFVFKCLEGVANAKNLAHLENGYDPTKGRHVSPGIGLDFGSPPQGNLPGRASPLSI